MRLSLVFALLGIVQALEAAGPARPRAGVDWPSFRGPQAGGVAEGYPTPARWDVGKGDGLRWKTAVPGLGHSSPVVWGDLVCVTSATSGAPEAGLKVGLYGDIEPVEDPSVHMWKVHCLDKRTGKLRWERTARTGPPLVKRHPKATHANSTLATDGRTLVALFGSEGLYAFDLEGKLLWKKDLGLLDSGFFRVPDRAVGLRQLARDLRGEGPGAGRRAEGVVPRRLRRRHGQGAVAHARADVPTWSTPTVLASGGRTQVVVNGYKHIGGYDLETGKELWRMTGGGDIPVPTPVVGHGLIFVTNAHGGAAPIFAVRPTATGDISLKEGETTNEHVAWSKPRDGGYMQTPLVYGDQLYVCRDNGVLSVYDAETGKRLYQERLGDGRTGFTASAVAADGKVYYTSEEGEVFVLKAGPTYEVLARNPLGEVTLATPAISEGALIFRTRGHVVSIGGKP